MSEDMVPGRAAAARSEVGIAQGIWSSAEMDTQPLDHSTREASINLKSVVRHLEGLKADVAQLQTQARETAARQGTFTEQVLAAAEAAGRAHSHCESMSMIVAGTREVRELVGEGEITEAVQAREGSIKQAMRHLGESIPPTVGIAGITSSRAGMLEGLADGLVGFVDAVEQLVAVWSQEAGELEASSSQSKLESLKNSVTGSLNAAMEQLNQLP